MQETGWDLNTINNQNYYELLEVTASKEAKNQKIVPLADFLRQGGLNRPV